MLLMALLVVLLAALVAFANGANDVSKGVATLVGAGLASERQALRWGAGWTLLGVAATGAGSSGLLDLFSGSILLAQPPVTVAWFAAVTLGAAGWLAIATRAGLPVSTTHALLGAIVGAGLVAAGPESVRWAALWRSALLPLLLSPLLSFALVSAAGPAVTGLFRRHGTSCVCVERAVTAPAAAGLAPRLPTGGTVRLIAAGDCPPHVAARANLLDALHWFGAGLTCFARGLNDAPKIVAPALAAGAVLGLGAAPLLALVAAAMGAGSYVAGRRVTRTLAHRLTPMSGAEALAANAATATLVTLASASGLPVSTTHVAAGAIGAVGLRRRAVAGRLAGEILAAWLVTLPGAGLLAALGLAAFR